MIYGFDIGINANSDVYVMKFNLTNNVNNNLSGDGLPDQAGEMATVNINGDESDIYGNIALPPAFANLDSSTHLLSSSGAINAGDVDSLDLDATIIDIGAEFYNFGYAPYDLQSDSTNDGSVFLSWKITETDSLIGYQVYYKINGDNEWINSNQTEISNYQVDGLENNILYDFSVSALYSNTETNKSRSIQSVPGRAIIQTQPKYLVSSFESGEESIITYDISNIGTKDLNYLVEYGFSLGSVDFSKENYADWTIEANQDRITNDVWITRCDRYTLLMHIIKVVVGIM